MNQEVIVIGAGIAGLSAGAELAVTCAVTVVEMEGTPAFHASGRSAALYIPTYGPPPIRRLTRASFDWFVTRGHGATEVDLITPRLVMFAADEEHITNLDTLIVQMGDAGGTLHPLTAEEAIAICPPLRFDWIAKAGLDRDAHDMDVAAIVEVYRRRLIELGGRILPDHRATALQRVGSGWRVETTGGELGADVVVNAAGAWVDQVAEAAGIDPIGFVPKRRTIGIGRLQPGTEVGEAFVAHAGEHWYLGREAGGLLFSPADETPSPACDAKPEEIDLARAIEGINEATTIGLRSVASSWAGLRTFSPDGSIVIGPDPAEPGFIWCGGQGGYGIHTAPAAARATAALAQGEPLPDDLVEGGLSVAALSPARFRR